MIQFGSLLNGNTYKRYLIDINETNFWMKSYFPFKEGSKYEMLHSKVQEYLIVVRNRDGHKK